MKPLKLKLTNRHCEAPQVPKQSLKTGLLRRPGGLLAMTIFFCLLFSVFCSLGYANNIRVENVSFYKSADQPAGTMDIKFDVTWDNSNADEVNGPTDANLQHYFDRAWVFVKFWNNAWATDGTVGWGHAILTTGGSLTTYSSTTHTGITSDGTGAFAKPGTGQTVRWNYGGAGGNGLAGTETIKVRVMAIEMVRVPTGSFDIGDGNATTESTNAFHVTDNTKAGTIGTTLLGSIKVDVNTYDDDQIELTGIGIDGDGGIDSNNDGTIGASPDNASFPTGYNAFYIMKYEVSQGQYRDFLNMLTRAQQNTRIVSQTASNYTMTNAATVTYRDFIRNPASIPAGAITFGCDYAANAATGDGTFNASGDGEWTAANYLSWMDVAAYADWAGLRPMTELEYEKASRGPTAAVNQEYAWGSTTIDYFSDLSGAGTTSEAKGATRPNANCNYSSATPDGPIRCGMFATASSTRAVAGASYYGVMELSGNLWERPVTVGNATGRAFDGVNGDGALAANGNANGTSLQYWPGYSAGEITGATGSGFRGGYWGAGATDARVSDRGFAVYTGTGRGSSGGARCARTSP